MKFFCRIKKDFKDYQLGENNFECIIFEFVLKYINWNFWWGKLIRLLFSSVVLPGFFMWKVVSRVVVFDSVAKLVVLGGLKDKELNFFKYYFLHLKYMLHVVIVCNTKRASQHFPVFLFGTNTAWESCRGASICWHMYKTVTKLSDVGPAIFSILYYNEI